MRIAIVGAGVSGLTCAHRLHPEHEIVVFEAGERAGGHANTVRVETEAGPTTSTPASSSSTTATTRTSNACWASSASRHSPRAMSFGVSDGAGFEYNGASPNGLFANRGHIVSAPSFHRMIAELDPLQPRRARAARLRRGSVAARLARAAGEYSTRFHRPADRAPGVGRVVGRSRADVVVPGALPGRVLREPWDARLPRPAALADGDRAARARYVEALTRPFARANPAVGTAVTEHRLATAMASTVSVAGGRARALRRGRARDALRSGARAALPTRAIASVSCSARSPISPTRRCCTPTARCCRGAGGRGRAGTTTSTTSRAGRSTVTYHMNSLQSLRADREFCVTLNRTAEIDPAPDHPHVSVRAPGLHARRAWPRRHATMRSAGSNRTHYCGAYWGWGFHEDGVAECAAGRAASSEPGAWMRCGV